MLERACLHACDGNKASVATLEQVIYELTEGERQLIDDLSLVKKVLSTHHHCIVFCVRGELSPSTWVFFQSCLNTCTAYCFYLRYQVYYEPMLKLDIMTESELGQIFGTLDSLIPLHQG